MKGMIAKMNKCIYLNQTDNVQKFEKREHVFQQELEE